MTPKDGLAFGFAMAMLIALGFIMGFKTKDCSDHPTPDAQVAA